MNPFVVQMTPLHAGIGVAVWFLAVSWPAAASPDASTYLPGQLLIKLRPAQSGAAPQTVSQLAGARVKATLPNLGWQLVQLPPGMSVHAAIEYYRNLPGVAYAEPNYRIRLFATPNDPRRDALWGLDKINAPQAWDQSTGDPGIVVATVDTGIDYNHPDLAANVWTNPGEIPGNGIDDDQNGYVDDVHGYDFVNNDGDPMDDFSHGTHVAGTIGAIGNNGIGVAGVDWHVRLMG